MKKNLYLGIFVFQAILLVFSSCVNQKQIAYFQKGVNQSDTISLAKIYTPKIQRGDILSISVGSLNPIASSFFNPYANIPVTNDNTSGATSGLTQAGNSSASVQTQSLSGYLVDSAGYIDYPIVGRIKVGGHTTAETREIIIGYLKEKYLKQPTVNVRFLNYKISVMGEVQHPSVYVIPNENITLPEALALAGDMTIFAKRENVLVIRDNNGKKEFGHIDFTTREVYSSPYYYLHANDIVYVEPGKGRIAQTDKVYQLLPVILSALSFLTIIIEYAHR